MRFLRALGITLVILSTPMLSAREQTPAAAVAPEPSLAPWTWPAPDNMWLLADRTYYDALVAEPHAARIFLVFPGWSGEFPHSEQPGNRFAWQVALGREIPIVGWESERETAQPHTRGNWGFGLWIPISFHMIEDFDDESNPIVDTDYRFGFMLKLRYSLSDQARLAVRFVPWAHESTHLGDEYTLIAARVPEFERINVSYEYRQYGISYQNVLNGRGLLTLRHGGTSLYGPDGYYSDHLLGETSRTLTPSTRSVCSYRLASYQS